jgi:hypothetical protein
VSSDPYVNATSFHATEVEPDTFSWGSRLVAAFQSGRFREGGASNIGWATSSDGGSTYTHGFLPATTVFAIPAGPYGRASDPAVAFDAKHGVWLIASLMLNKPAGGVVGAAVIVNRSTDGGLTWSSPVTAAVASRGQDLDKDWITCDDTPASPRYGNCYLQWDNAGQLNQLETAFSSNGGRTWTKSAVPARSEVIAGQPLTQPNGTVIVPIDSAFENAIESFVSTNGGASYSGPFAISAITDHTENGKLRSAPLPSAQVNGEGRVYVAWADCRFTKHCRANDIVYSSSSDGQHWSAVTRIPLGPTGRDQDRFLPGLAVDRATSGPTTALALTYYYDPRARCTTTTCQLDVGFVSSADGGASWSAPLRIAGPSRLRELPETEQGFMVGDYLSTSFVAGALGDAAQSVFAVGMPSGQNCVLGNGSCNEPMESPAAALAASAPAQLASAAPVLSTRSDHAAPARRFTQR